MCCNRTLSVSLRGSRVRSLALDSVNCFVVAKEGEFGAFCGVDEESKPTLVVLFGALSGIEEV